MRYSLFLVVFGFFVQQDGVSFKPRYTIGPHALVYKTKGDYRKNVAVTLTEDKSRISSYPDPKDVRIAFDDVDGKDVRIVNGFDPTQLKKGFLLDNRGIGRNVAFLKMTYEEFAKLDSTPSARTLYTMILDKDPLLEMYDCGDRASFKDMVSQLNELIEKGELRRVCRKIK